MTKIGIAQQMLVKVAHAKLQGNLSHSLGPGTRSHRD
jgi:hypothetical protein